MVIGEDRAIRLGHITAVGVPAAVFLCRDLIYCGSLRQMEVGPHEDAKCGVKTDMLASMGLCIRA